MPRAVSDTRRRREAAVLVGAAILVVALLAVFAVELSKAQSKSRQDLAARVHDRSLLAAALMDSLFGSVEQQEVPAYRQRYGGRTISSRALDAARQQNAYVAVLDGSAHVLAASKGFTAQARKDLSRSAALVLVRSGHPYGLGNVLPYGRTGVINFAVAFPTRYGKRYALTGFAPRALKPFLTGELRKIPGVRGAHNYVIEGNNVVLASTNPSIHTGYRFTKPADLAALSRPNGTRNGRYYDQGHLANSTWRILLAAPSGPLFASVSGPRKWVPWLLFAALAIVAAVALALGSRVLRSAEAELRDANSRLASLNQKLEEANAVLAHDALHDPLTGLPNRALFMDRVEQVLQRSIRDESLGSAVLFVDLDDFKLVNDRLGHAAGDHFLVAVAGRLHQVLRPGDTVARIGGDEFALVLDRVTEEHDAAIVAERLLQTLGQPVVIGTHELPVKASIGIAFTSADVNAAELVLNADVAMYEAKHRGKAGYAVFDEDMHRRVAHRRARADELRRAVEEGLIEVHYQPIVDLQSREIAGFEALARWPGEWEEVAPREFIPIAEESGEIARLGDHVLRAALAQLADWRRAGLVSDTTYVSVNLSRRQLDDRGLAGNILAAIEDAGLPGSVVRLEVSEGTLIDESGRMQPILSEICSRGVKLQLDHFGTEYSSLPTMLQLPVAALKLDRSVVASLLEGRDQGEEIARGTIALAHGLELQAIADGVEHPAQVQRLRDLACDYGQGFHFSEPLDGDRARELLVGWSPVLANRTAIA